MAEKEKHFFPRMCSISFSLLTILQWIWQMTIDLFALRNMRHHCTIKHRSIHLTSLVLGTLSSQQTQRLIENRFINLSGGKNCNMDLDDYVELVNKDTKILAMVIKQRMHNSTFQGLSASNRSSEKL